MKERPFLPAQITDIYDWDIILLQETFRVVDPGVLGCETYVYLPEKLEGGMRTPAVIVNKKLEHVHVHFMAAGVPWVAVQ
eukprot:9042909-Prorocentrum_lima.AAC.1